VLKLRITNTNSKFDEDNLNLITAAQLRFKNFNPFYSRN